MQILNEFSLQLVNLLNDNNVVPDSDGDPDLVQAVMIITGRIHEDAPLGASVNWDETLKMWVLSLEISQAERCEDDDTVSSFPF